MKKKTILYLAIALLVVDVFSISYFRILDRFELVSLDFRYNLRLAFPKKTNPDVVVIEIGEDSLQALGRWPLPRDYHAAMIDVLKACGARLVIFDILFCEPTGWDTVLAASAKDAGNVYFPFALRLDEKAQKNVAQATGIDAPLLDELRNAARGAGFINKIADSDGKVRRAPLFILYGGRLYPSMTLQAACDYLGADCASIAPDRRNRVTVGRASLPIDENGMVLLDFAGTWADAFTHYSFIDILAAYQESGEGKAARLDLARLKGKVCFIGLTATGTQELGPIPIEKSYPMLGIHANLFNMLTQGIAMGRLSRTDNLLILIVLSLGLFVFIMRVRPFRAFFVTLGAILALFLVSIALFVSIGIWIDIVCPSLVLFGLYIGVTLTRYIGEIRVREKIQKELSVATSIQKCFLPEAVPEIEGLEIAVEMKTAKEVGGDLYDFIRPDDETLGIMVGDVSGKGVPAALFMARVETLFRVFSKTERQPAGVIAKLNGEIASDERSGLFTTLVYAVFHIKQKKVVISDAGHLPVILLRADALEKIASEDGMAVGVMEGVTFSDRTLSLSSGDVMIFYTDGAAEARDSKGNEFGIDRCIAIARAGRHLSAKEILSSLLRELRLFQGKAVQHDDITIVVVKVY